MIRRSIFQEVLDSYKEHISTFYLNSPTPAMRISDILIDLENPLEKDDPQKMEDLRSSYPNSYFTVNSLVLSYMLRIQS